MQGKLGTIWLCSLLDTLEAQERVLPEVEKEAAARGFSSLVHNTQELKKFCTVVAELLSLYTREEQIFLVNNRNQMVHSYLSGRHRPKIPVKYCSGQRLVREDIPGDEYHAIFNSFTVDRGLNDIGKVLCPLIQRALDQRLRYWQAIAVFQQHSDKLYEALRTGKTFDIRI